MRKNSIKIPFEIHLTASDLSEEDISSFTELCKDIGGKSLVIELSRGKVARQPMFTKTVYLDKTKAVLKKSTDYIHTFAKNNFLIIRLKIEVPSQFANDIHSFSDDESQTYFEWHGKINPKEIRDLSNLCETHSVHLSRNSLKDEKDKKFLTLREYGTIKSFEKKLNLLKIDIEKSGGFFYKQESEYCIYDNNILLDEGWLSE